jgi:hypothetical protein
MYCKKCGSNNAFPAFDINFNRRILICPDCKEVTWPVPSTEELAKDVERIKEKMRSIPNMPELEKGE